MLCSSNYRLGTVKRFGVWGLGWSLGWSLGWDLDWGKGNWNRLGYVDRVLIMGEVVLGISRGSLYDW